MFLTRIVLLLLAFVLVGGAQDVSRKSRNVEQLYQSVVAQRGLDLFDGEWAKTDKIEIRDTKNGYLKITGGIDGWLEVALFRKKDRSPVLVIGVTGCGPACGTELHAFEFKNGNAENVSEKLFPRFFENEIDNKLYRRTGKKEDYYGDILDVLPRKGTTIKTVLEDENDVLYEIEWKNDIFEIKRNVSDLYSVFPGNLLNPENGRKGKVIIEDTKNGYLKLRIPTATVDAALFRKKDGSPVLFVVENYCGTGRCVTGEMEIRELVGGKWIDITAEVLPKGLTEKRIHAKSDFAAKHGYQYKVPRKGRTVRIVEGDDGKTIYRLDWKNEKFVVR
ncbi:MAG: hypothetical protein HKN25_03580 [Pyrinomonadaceae bacterium]|nr:hypothetical protein [Pyrinomonadaceae bacterium]